MITLFTAEWKADEESDRSVLTERRMLRKVTAGACWGQSYVS